MLPPALVGTRDVSRAGRAGRVRLQRVIHLPQEYEDHRKNQQLWRRLYGENEQHLQALRLAVSQQGHAVDTDAVAKMGEIEAYMIRLSKGISAVDRLFQGEVAANLNGD